MTTEPQPSNRIRDDGLGVGMDYVTQPSSEGLDLAAIEEAYYHAVRSGYPGPLAHWAEDYGADVLAALRQAQAQVEQLQEQRYGLFGTIEQAVKERDEAQAELATANEQNAFLREQYQGLFANTVEREEHERVMAERDEAKRGYEIALDQWNEHREDNYRLEARVRELERALREIEGAGGGLVHHALRERARAVLEAKGESNAKSG